MKVVAGAGVTLEPQSASHASELFAVVSDPSLYEFIDNKPPATEQAFRKRLQTLESRLSPDGTEQWLNWIVRNATGDLVGYVQATVTPDRSAEIAYVLGRAFWQKGYAYAACAAMIGELRSTYGANRITATLDPANQASLALLRKLGLGLVWADEAAHEVGYALDLG
jgi:[ribosomal protein S5]-alanine N-acetyltransferase